MNLFDQSLTRSFALATPARTGYAESYCMNKLSVLKEFLEFLKFKKKWWFVATALFLLFFGSLFVFSQGSVLAPFIYTVF